jgi:hypothetical protein
MTAGAMARDRFVASLKARQESDTALVMTWPLDAIAAALGIKEPTPADAHLVQRLNGTKRLHGRLASRLKNHAGLGGDAQCPAQLQPLCDPSRLAPLCDAAGLTQQMACLQGVLARADITALDRVYGADVVAFAIRAQQKIPAQKRAATATMTSLYDAVSVRQLGERTVLAHVQSAHGDDVRWLKPFMASASSLADGPSAPAMSVVDMPDLIAHWSTPR